MIDLRLQVAEEIGGALHLVDDRAVGQRREESPGVGGREFARIERLEADVRQVRKRRSAERGLA